MTELTQHPFAGLDRLLEAKRDVSHAERESLASAGDALDDGSYPIATREDLKNAISLRNRGHDPAAARALIMKRAAELGAEDLLPKEWGESGSKRFAAGTFDPSLVTRAANGQFTSPGGAGGSTGAGGNNSLGAGAQGKDVSKLQAYLHKLGYTTGTDASGTMGPGTVAAVRKYQQDHGLKVDGLAGVHTFSTLRDHLGAGASNGHSHKNGHSQGVGHRNSSARTSSRPAPHGGAARITPASAGAPAGAGTVRGGSPKPSHVQGKAAMSTSTVEPVVEYKNVPVGGVQTIDEGTGIVEAIVSVTGVKDRVNDIIQPGSYQKTLAARKPKGVWSHDWDTPTSKTLDAVELMPGDNRLPTVTRDGKAWPKEAGALLIKMQFNLETQRGKEAFSDVKFFGPDQEWSIGYNVPAGAASFERKSGTRNIKELELYEYSPVLFGAMPDAATRSVKSAQAAMKAVNSTMDDDDDEDAANEDANNPAEVAHEQDVAIEDDSGPRMAAHMDEPSALTEDQLQQMHDEAADEIADEISIHMQQGAEQETDDAVHNSERREAGLASKADKPGHGGGNAQTLRDYWAHGKGAAKIGWGRPGDWETCVGLVSKYMDPEQARGYCQLRHIAACGEPAGPNAHGGKAAESARKSLFEAVARASSPVSLPPALQALVSAGLATPLDGEIVSIAASGSGSKTAGEIQSPSYGLKVSGINTDAHPAKVVQVEPRWDWPAVDFVDDPMGDSVLPGTVAITKSLPGPDPAVTEIRPVCGGWAVPIDAIFDDAGESKSDGSVSMLEGSPVVLLAHTDTKASGAAAAQQGFGALWGHTGEGTTFDENFIPEQKDVSMTSGPAMDIGGVGGVVGDLSGQSETARSKECPNCHDDDLVPRRSGGEGCPSCGYHEATPEVPYEDVGEARTPYDGALKSARHLPCPKCRSCKVEGDRCAGCGSPLARIGAKSGEEKAGKFLPCPKCRSRKADGDHCAECGAKLAPMFGKKSRMSASVTNGPKGGAADAQTSADPSTLIDNDDAPAKRDVKMSLKPKDWLPCPNCRKNEPVERTGKVVCKECGTSLARKTGADSEKAFSAQARQYALDNPEGETEVKTWSEAARLASALVRRERAHGKPEAEEHPRGVCQEHVGFSQCGRREGHRGEHETHTNQYGTYRRFGGKLDSPFNFGPVITRHYDPASGVYPEGHHPDPSITTRPRSDAPGTKKSLDIDTEQKEMTMTEPQFLTSALPGSMEDLQGRLTAATDEWARIASKSDEAWTTLEGTFPDFIQFTAYNEKSDLPRQSWQAGFSVNDDGTVDLDDPQAIDVPTMVVPSAVKALAGLSRVLESKGIDPSLLAAALDRVADSTQGLDEIELMQFEAMKEFGAEGLEVKASLGNGFGGGKGGTFDPSEGGTHINYQGKVPAAPAEHAVTMRHEAGVGGAESLDLVKGSKGGGANFGARMRAARMLRDMHDDAKADAPNVHAASDHETASTYFQLAHQHMEVGNAGTAREHASRALSAHDRAMKGGDSFGRVGGRAVATLRSFVKDVTDDDGDDDGPTTGKTSGARGHAGNIVGLESGGEKSLEEKSKKSKAQEALFGGPAKAEPHYIEDTMVDDTAAMLAEFESMRGE